MIRKFLLIAILTIAAYSVSSQDSLGLVKNSINAYQGYTLYSPFFTSTTYLLDMDGKAVKTWETGFMPGAVECLTPEGNLLKACRIINHDFRISGKGGLIQLYDNKGIVRWSYNLIDEQICQHHSILLLPNGNILAIVWQKFNKNQAIEMGRNPRLVDEYLYMLKLLEIKPKGKSDGEIVWEWNSEDHLVQDFDKTKPNYGNIAKHPHLIDFNYVVRPHNKKDYLHANSIDYNAEKDLIMISVRAMDEVWIIDHSIALGMTQMHEGGRYNRGGDLLMRWGNTKAYKSGNDSPQILFGQHDAHWITEGNNKGKVMVFNNGRDSIRPWSSVDIYDINLEDSMGQIPSIAKLVWRYQAPKKKEFYSTFLSGAQMLPNGNILITQGQAGRIFEIDSLKNIVWEFVNPHVGFSKGSYQNDKKQGKPFVFKAKRYSPNYSGIKKVLTNSN